MITTKQKPNTHPVRPMVKKPETVKWKKPKLQSSLRQALLDDEDRLAGELDAQAEPPAREVSPPPERVVVPPRPLPHSCASPTQNVPLESGPIPSAPSPPNMGVPAAESAEEVLPPPPPPPPDAPAPELPNPTRPVNRCRVIEGGLVERVYNIKVEENRDRTHLVSTAEGVAMRVFGSKPQYDVESKQWSYNDVIPQPKLNVDREWAYLYVMGPGSSTFLCLLVWVLMLVWIPEWWKVWAACLAMHALWLSFIPTRAHVVSYTLFDRSAVETSDVRSPECIYATPSSHPDYHYFRRVEADVVLDCVGGFRMLGRKAITDKNEFSWNLRALAENRAGLSVSQRAIVCGLRYARGAGRLSFVDRRTAYTAQVSMTAALSYSTGRQQFGVSNESKIRTFMLRHIPGSNWNALTHHNGLIDTSHYIYDRNVFDTISRGAEWSHHFPSDPDLPWARGVRMDDDIVRRGVPKI